MTTRQRVPDSPVGPIVLVAEDGQLTEVRFDSTSRNGHASTEPAGETPGDVLGERASNENVLADAARQLDEYFAGHRTRFDVPLAHRGTVFEREVWARVEQIPFGTTVSYGQLAIRLGRRGAARAVGRANARNPLPLLVPCHRVIGASGSLTGYGGGLGTKRFLLAFESGRKPTPPGSPEAGRR